MRTRMLELGPVVYDADQDMIIVTYQTFILRTRHYVILVDTCTGENKAPMGPRYDFPKQPWLDGLAAEGLGLGDIDFVFCTHLHFDHCGWNTRLIDGRWVPTFPNASYLFSRREYDFWAAATAAGDDPPGRCAGVLPARGRGRPGPGWSTTIMCWTTISG